MKIINHTINCPPLEIHNPGIRCFLRGHREDQLGYLAGEWEIVSVTLLVSANHWHALYNVKREHDGHRDDATHYQIVPIDQATPEQVRLVSRAGRSKAGFAPAIRRSP